MHCNGLLQAVKLDRLLAKHGSMGRKAAHHCIASGRVVVNGVCITDNQYEVDRFTAVSLDEEVIQQPERALYLMVHKPEGVLSATSDAVHSTVLDLIDDADKHTLHIAGRLDRSTTGLVLLTNDGRWSKKLMSPESKVSKVYWVETAEPLDEGAVAAFAKGFYFHTEGITTLPAELVLLGTHQARLTLYEGRYHQVKRMFHRVGNRVLRLHRESIGGLVLPSQFPSGAWRALTQEEVQLALRQ